jgi:hypothetical protein
METNPLMVYKSKFAACSDIRTKHTKCNARRIFLFFYFKPVGTWRSRYANFMKITSLCLLLNKLCLFSLTQHKFILIQNLTFTCVLRVSACTWPLAGIPIHKPYKEIYNKIPVILMRTLVAIHEGLNLIKCFIYF